MFDVLYRNVRVRVSDLGRTLTGEQLAMPVAGTPRWTARQVIAHLVGVAADVTSGNLAGAPQDEWTAAQVRAREGRSVAELCAEWDEVGPLVDARLADRTLSPIPVYDALTHECDLRETFRLPRPPVEDVEAVARSAGKGVVTHYGGPGTVVVRSGDHEWTGGSGQPRVELTVEPYELFRGVLSRRSRRQMRTWRWGGDGDPGDVIERLPVFGARDDDQPVPA